MLVLTLPAACRVPPSVISVSMDIGGVRARRSPTAVAYRKVPHSSPYGPLPSRPLPTRPSGPELWSKPDARDWGVKERTIASRVAAPSFVSCQALPDAAPRTRSTSARRTGGTTMFTMTNGCCRKSLNRCVPRSASRPAGRPAPGSAGSTRSPFARARARSVVRCVGTDSSDR
ncbi:hypothetical protein GCM10023238_14640 [Streptomyces heliomycini]